MFLELIILSSCKNTDKHTNTWTHTRAGTDEHTIVAFCKKATITMMFWLGQIFYLLVILSYFRCIDGMNVYRRQLIESRYS